MNALELRKSHPRSTLMLDGRTNLELCGEAELADDLGVLARASRANASVFAPVQTIFPELKMSAVVLGARMRIMAAAKRCE